MGIFSGRLESRDYLSTAFRCTYYNNAAVNNYIIIIVVIPLFFIQEDNIIINTPLQPHDIKIICVWRALYLLSLAPTPIVCIKWYVYTL